MRLSWSDIAKLPPNVQKKIRNYLAVQSPNVESDISIGAQAADALETPDTQCNIHFHCIRRRECDADNMASKWVTDQLVNDGIIKDDKPKYVGEVTYSQKAGKEEQTIITITW